MKNNKLIKNIKLSAITILIFLICSLITSCQMVYPIQLSAPNIRLDENKISWDYVEKATSYIVKVNDDEFIATEHSYTIEKIIGTFSVKVKAVNDQNYSDWSNVVTITINKNFKIVLDAPIIKAYSDKIAWDQIDNATSYNIYLDNELYLTTTNLIIPITDELRGKNITVCALSSNENYEISQPSNYIILEKKVEYLKIQEVNDLIDENYPNSVIVNIKCKVTGFDANGYIYVSDDTGVIYLRNNLTYLKLGDEINLEAEAYVYSGTENYQEYRRQLKLIKYTNILESSSSNVNPLNLTFDDLNKYNLSNAKDAPFLSQIVNITGILKTSSSKYNFHLVDENNNKLVTIDNNSTNFNNDIDDYTKNIFLSLNDNLITIKGVIIKYAKSANSFVIACIGLDNEIINHSKLETPKISYDIENNTINWEHIKNATYYDIYIDGNYSETTKNNYYYISKYTEYKEIAICAVDEGGNYQTSELSNRIINNSPNKKDYDVNLFMINDTHGSFVTNQTPGLEKISTLINQLESQNGEYIKIANGDIFQGSYVSNTHKGLPLIDGLNKMEFDAFIVGNHDFDWSLDLIKTYKDGNILNGEANFPFVCANIIDKKTNQLVDFLEPYTIVNKNGVKTGIIGLIGYELESSILTSMVKDYDFVYPLEIVKELASQLRNSNECDSVIVAIHDYDQALNNELASLTGDSQIDAILCGHTHQNIYEKITRNDGKEIAIVQNKDKNQYATSLILEYQNSEYLSHTFQSINVTSYAKDGTFNDIISKYQTTIDEANRIIGTSYSYIAKSTLGKAIVNEMVTSLNIDFAIINTAGVRSTISSGNITVATVFEIFPFDNRIGIVNITGKNLKSLYNANSSYLYVSDSFNIQTLSDTTTYKLGVIDFVFESPYYKEFKSLVFNDTKVLLRDVALDYIEKNY